MDLDEHPSASTAQHTAHQQAAVGDTRGLLCGAGGVRGRAAQLRAADARSPRLWLSVAEFAVTSQPLKAEDASLEIRWTPRPSRSRT